MLRVPMHFFAANEKERDTAAKIDDSPFQLIFRSLVSSYRRVDSE